MDSEEEEIEELDAQPPAPKRPRPPAQPNPMDSEDDGIEELDAQPPAPERAQLQPLQKEGQKVRSLLVHTPPDHNRPCFLFLLPFRSFFTPTYPFSQSRNPLAAPSGGFGDPRPFGSGWAAPAKIYAMVKRLQVSYGCGVAYGTSSHAVLFSRPTFALRTTKTLVLGGCSGVGEEADGEDHG
jgi:hypothetical protein